MRLPLTHQGFLSNLNLGRILGLVAATVLVAAPSPIAQAQAKRFPVTNQMVLSAMQLRQLSIDGAQIRISAPVTASVPNPMLDIVTFSSIDKQNAQIRMTCRNKGECLSFYVAVTWPEHPAAAPQATSQSSSQNTQSSQKVAPISAITSASSIPATPPTQAQPIRYELPPSAPTRPDLRAGTPVTLVMEEGRIHIRLRVVSQQNGKVGENVRVSTPDRKQAFVAEIVAPNLLKGSF